MISKDVLSEYIEYKEGMLYCKKKYSDKSVVGTLINFKPLLNRLAAKLLISPVIPPPIEIKQSSLEKFFFKRISKILLTLF